ncbi:serine hydrolase [Aureisphaera galaxeae]|uniref:serine hydrolase domain-containing protein n=1 Tax=Aureisphaera galaxeae TaxID=1538023 RepID=UPI00234FB76B|nr:serine hydrolase [Aureisphaera galaxeae]MDC8004683.1 serine hydrolase [Aureisphaera galaxeae]
MKRKFIFSTVSLILLILLAQSCFYSPRYIYRVIAWQDSDYDDYKKFKSAPISPSEAPYHFTKGTLTQEQQTQQSFEKSETIKDLDSFLETNNTYSFLVIRKDTLLYEKYFNGATRESFQTSFSVSKSVLSLLIGKALEEGHITSIDDLITQYIPELEEEDERFRTITLKHLLSMQSGIAYSGKVSFPFVTADDPKTYYHPNLRKVAIKHSKIDTIPGVKFKYNNYNALLIGLVLERATKQSVSSYLQDRIWKPMGTEFEASWSTDENGFEKMESGLNARPIDFAKIGRLALQQGAWNGQQLINSEWFSLSTQPKMNADFDGYGNPKLWVYNYFWWGIPERENHSDFMAIGNMGQFIYVSPRSQTIIVRNGEEANGFGDGTWIKIFHEFMENQSK